MSMASRKEQMNEKKEDEEEDYAENCILVASVSIYYWNDMHER